MRSDITPAHRQSSEGPGPHAPLIEVLHGNSMTLRATVATIASLWKLSSFVREGETMPGHPCPVADQESSHATTTLSSVRLCRGCARRDRRVPSAAPDRSVHDPRCILFRPKQSETGGKAARSPALRTAHQAMAGASRDQQNGQDCGPARFWSERAHDAHACAVAMVVNRRFRGNGGFILGMDEAGSVTYAVRLIPPILK